MAQNPGNAGKHYDAAIRQWVSEELRQTSECTQNAPRETCSVEDCGNEVPDERWPLPAWPFESAWAARLFLAFCVLSPIAGLFVGVVLYD